MRCGGGIIRSFTLKLNHFSICLSTIGFILLLGAACSDVQLDTDAEVLDVTVTAESGTFIESQFNFCPLVWMCHSRELNQKINHLHERALRVVYTDHSLTFLQLLEMDKSFTIHERNLQKLATEMYKVKRNLCPEPFQKLFTPAVRGRND